MSPFLKKNKGVIKLFFVFLVFFVLILFGWIALYLQLLSSEFLLPQNYFIVTYTNQEVFYGVIFLIALFLISVFVFYFLITSHFKRLNSKKHHLNKQLDRLSERIKLVASSAGIGFWYWDILANEFVWDKQMYELNGIKEKITSNDQALEVLKNMLYPADAERVFKEIELAFLSKSSYTLTFRVVRPDNQEIRYHKAHYIIKRNKKGRVIYMTGVLWDITEEKEIEKSKSEIISLTAHELRRGPALIKMMSSALLDDSKQKLTKSQKKYIQSIDEANDRNLSLVNNLLNVARLEMGKFMVYPEWFNLNEFLIKIVNLFNIQIKKKKQDLKLSFPNHSVLILQDSNLLQIIISNLISNAIAYTPEGGKIEFDIKTEIKKEPILKIRIKDSGCGIPKKDQKKLFSKMYRASNAYQYRSDGNGLGLYMVKLILDQISGSIAFTSIENKGTEFLVILPIQLADES